MKKTMMSIFILIIIILLAILVYSCDSIVKKNKTINTPFKTMNFNTPKKTPVKTPVNIQIKTTKKTARRN